MPSVSEKQRRFFGLVRSVQKGQAQNVSPQAASAAANMSIKSVRDFARKHQLKALKKKVR